MKRPCVRIPPHLVVAFADRRRLSSVWKRILRVAAQLLDGEQLFDAVLLDMLLALDLKEKERLDFGGIEVLRQIKAYNATIQIIAVTGYSSPELAAEARAAGALDYVTKDLDIDHRLPGIMRLAIARAQALRVMEAAKQAIENELDDVRLSKPYQLIAGSTAMRQMLRRTQALAQIDSPLLIVGEPGVGKELIAKVIHLNSSMATGSFVVTSCRSLSHNLIELWGEASRSSSGLCAQAENGSLVLKDIQDLSFGQQKQLVALVEQQTYTPVCAQMSVRSNLRMIATTTADLVRLVRQGRFWRGLQDVLSVAALYVPPLRDRRDKDDILEIASYLLQKYGLAEGISPMATEFVVAYDYAQGNIEELEEILRGAADRANGGIIQPEHLPEEVLTPKNLEKMPNMPQS
jgi:DNA-binding NtrC family response regulator